MNLNNIMAKLVEDWSSVAGWDRLTDGQKKLLVRIYEDHKKCIGGARIANLLKVTADPTHPKQGLVTGFLL